MSGAIEVEKETRARLLASITRFVAEELDEDIGDLKAQMVLDFVLTEIGPTIYNAGAADAERYLRDRLDDMGGTVHRPEFGYWTRRPK